METNLSISLFYSTKEKETTFLIDKQMNKFHVTFYQNSLEKQLLIIITVKNIPLS